MKSKSKTLIDRIRKLSPGQLALLGSMIDTFEQPIEGWRLDSSDAISTEFLIAFGDILKLHHTMTNDYLDKHRFESAIERVYGSLKIEAHRAAKNNPGRDITVNGVAWSLKTQGDKNIKRDLLHISKFMELGKGAWENESDLPGLRDRFLRHLTGYNRIFQLRYFALGDLSIRDPALGDASKHFYELVEIPVKLLREAEKGKCVMVMDSTQRPKPGYCTITDRKGGIRFRLYFDGGTERKLQIKELRKNLCVTHATWKF
jgi:Type II site-specific deoxyribonuclease